MTRVAWFFFTAAVLSLPEVQAQTLCPRAFSHELSGVHYYDCFRTCPDNGMDHFLAGHHERLPDTSLGCTANQCRHPISGYLFFEQQIKTSSPQSQKIVAPPIAAESKERLVQAAKLGIGRIGVRDIQWVAERSDSRRPYALIRVTWRIDGHTHYAYVAHEVDRIPGSPEDFITLRPDGSYRRESDNEFIQVVVQQPDPDQDRAEAEPAPARAEP